MNNHLQKSNVKNIQVPAGVPKAANGTNGAVPAEWAIEVIDVVRTYKVGASEVMALRGINLQVRPGKWIGVKGRSGSGKTTLLNCIGGLDHPNSGTVRFYGRDITRLSDSELTRWRR